MLIIIDKWQNSLRQKQRLVVNFSHKMIVIHDVNVSAS